MRLTTIALLTTCLVFGSCKEHGHGGHGEDHGSHDFDPKHEGGEILYLAKKADHKPFVELVHDEQAGTLKLYGFDGHHEVLAPEKAPVLSFSETKPPKQVTAAGDGAVWVFTDDALKDHPHGVRLKIKFPGENEYNESRKFWRRRARLI